MKPVAYWIGATILIVVLLATVFLGGNFIAEKHWPFPLIWGGFIAILGVVLVIIGRTFPQVLWGIRESTTAIEPRILHRAAWIATIFGTVIVIGGVGLAYTGHVEVLIGAFVMGVIVLRTALPRRPSDGDSGPAA
jgi:hypothetical protein